MWTRINQPFPLPTEVRHVLTTLYNAGFEAYLVGGSVRDWLRNQPIKDYDIATSAKPEDVEKLFPKVIGVGRAFGVMKVLTEPGREVEVATFRKEADYKDHRHPSKVTFSDVQADASRRDFTVNALYYDMKNGQVLDLFSGIEDLKNKQIRAIGDAKARFKEDALRLLRAVRFAARFGFSIEAQTREAIVESAALIRKVSVERVRDELERMLTHTFCKHAFLELEALGLLENVLPEISVAKLEQKKVWDQTIRVLANLGAYTVEEPIAFYWALLFLPTLRLQLIEKRDLEARNIAARLKLSNETSDQMAYLVRETPKFKDAFSMREATLLRWMSEAHFELLMRFHELDAISYDGNLAGLEFVKTIYPEAKRRFYSKPLITGDDLVRLGMSPGRQFTEILRTVEDLALEGKLTEPEQALEYVLTHFVK
jgi:poly(A) polymerase